MGPAGLTLRAISRASGVSSSSMMHHLDSRERLLRVCAHTSATARLRMLTDAVIDTGPVGVLPRDDSELLATRSWLGRLETWRTMPCLGPSLLPAREGELAVLSRALEHATAWASLRDVQALVDGFRVALCLPGATLGVLEAREALASRLSEMVGLTVSVDEPLVERGAWGWPYLPQPRAAARSTGWG